MGILRDSRIVARIGLGRDEWLVSDEDCVSEEDMSSIDSSVLECDEDEFIDNLECDADFDRVDDGYSGQDGVMRGAIRRMKKSKFDKYSTCTGIYSSDGMYRIVIKGCRIISWQEWPCPVHSHTAMQDDEQHRP